MKMELELALPAVGNPAILVAQAPGLGRPLPEKLLAAGFLSSLLIGAENNRLDSSPARIDSPVSLGTLQYSGGLSPADGRISPGFLNPDMNPVSQSESRCRCSLCYEFPARRGLLSEDILSTLFL